MRKAVPTLVDIWESLLPRFGNWENETEETQKNSIEWTYRMTQNSQDKEQAQSGISRGRKNYLPAEGMA